MIYTITFNPALDYILKLKKFEKNIIQRTESELILPGGKGINVSTVLNNLEVDTTALGFISGFTGKEIERLLNDMNVKTNFIDLKDGYSRINVKIASDEETAINTNGPKIDSKHIELLLKKLEKLKQDDILVLSGSVPKTIADDIYETICKKIQNKNIKIVVDATKGLLLNVLKYKPFLVKPNKDELGELFGVNIHTKEEAYVYGEKLKEKGAINVLISMGDAGAVLIDENNCKHFMEAPKGKTVNTVGAGDSMVAGFITGYLKYNDYSKALKMGVSAGTASAQSEYLATKEQVYNLFNR